MSPDHTPSGKGGGKTVAQVLQRSLRILTAATAILYVLLLAAGVKVYLDGRNTTRVLCTYRADLAARVIASTQFLKNNPEGAVGIDAKTILENIENQQRAILAFKDLNCSSVDVALPTPTPKPPATP